jgi:hypothetical protein
MSGTMRTILSFGQIVGLVRLFNIRIASEEENKARQLLLEGEGSFIRKLTFACNEYWKSILSEKMEEINAFIIKRESDLQDATDADKPNIESEIASSKKKLSSLERLATKTPFTMSGFVSYVPQDFYTQYEAVSPLKPIDAVVVVNTLKSSFLGTDDLLSDSYKTELYGLNSVPEIEEKVGDDLKKVIDEALAAREAKQKSKPASDSDLHKKLRVFISSLPGRSNRSRYERTDAKRDAAYILISFTSGGRYKSLSQVLLEREIEGLPGHEFLVTKLSGALIAGYNNSRRKTDFDDIIQQINKDALTATEDSSIESSAISDIEYGTNDSIYSANRYFKTFMNYRMKRGPGITELGGRGAPSYSSDVEAYSDLMYRSRIDTNTFDPVSDNFESAFSELKQNPNYRFTKKEMSRLKNLPRSIIKEEKNRLMREEGKSDQEAQKEAEAFLRSIKIEPSSSSATSRSISDISVGEEGETSIFDVVPAEGDSPLESVMKGIVDAGENYDDFTTIMGRHMGPLKTNVINADYGDVPKVIPESLYSLIMDLNKATFKSDTSSVNTLLNNLATLVKQNSDYLANKAFIQDMTKPESAREAKKALNKPIDDFFRGVNKKKNVEDLLKKMSHNVWNYINNNLTLDELKILEREWAKNDPNDLLKGAFYSQGRKLEERTNEILEQGIKDNQQDAIDKASELQEYNLLSILKKHRRLSPNENNRFSQLDKDLRTKRGISTPPQEADYKYNDPILQSINYTDSNSVKLKDVVRWTEWLAWAKKLSNPGDLPASEVDEDNEYAKFAKELSNKLISSGVPRSSVFGVKPSSPIGERGARLRDLENAMKSGDPLTSDPPISLAEMTKISEEFKALAEKESAGTIKYDERKRLVDLAKKIYGDRDEFINVESLPRATRRDDLPTTTVSRLLKTVPTFSKLLLKAKGVSTAPVVTSTITPEEIAAAEAWVKKTFAKAPPSGATFSKLNDRKNGRLQGVTYDKLNPTQASYLLEKGADGKSNIEKIYDAFRSGQTRTSSYLFWQSFAF